MLKEFKKKELKGYDRRKKEGCSFGLEGETSAGKGQGINFNRKTRKKIIEGIMGCWAPRVTRYGKDLGMK